jgi:hypothetical protein
LADDFYYQDGTNRKIKAGKGATVRLDATGDVIPGYYTVGMTVAIGDDPAETILGTLVVTDSGGSIS